MQFIDLGAQFRAYKDEILAEIAAVCESASFIGGEKLDIFEQNLARYVGAKHAIGCSSGTSALLLALLALDIKRGDEVIVPSFTFIATAEMVALLGAKPVFADISLQDYNIDAAKIEPLITPRTRAVIAVSIFGQMPDFAALTALCAAHGIALIEDGAQSFGAEFEGKKSCAVAQISCTSFFPSKPLGAYGDAGAVFTNDENLAKRVRIFLNHGQIARYTHKFIGINGRLDTIQAAILNVKLRHLDDELKARNKIAEIYSAELKNAILPRVKNGAKSAWAQYSVRVENRAQVIERLQKCGIPSAIHYPIGLHMQEAFRARGGRDSREFDLRESYEAQNSLPNTERVCREILSLPMSAFLSEADQNAIIKAFNQ